MFLVDYLFACFIRVEICLDLSYVSYLKKENNNNAFILGFQS